MPAFSFKLLRVNLREDFLKALAPIFGKIQYPQSLTCYDDVKSFKEWKYEVPNGAWWVEWQSFKVEGLGAGTIRPLHLNAKSQGQYLGKFQSGVFQPAPPAPKASSSDIEAAVWGNEE